MIGVATLIGHPPMTNIRRAGRAGRDQDEPGAKDRSGAQRVNTSGLFVKYGLLGFTRARAAAAVVIVTGEVTYSWSSSFLILSVARVRRGRPADRDQAGRGREVAQLLQVRGQHNREKKEIKRD